jgi:hypothetical protein
MTFQEWKAEYARRRAEADQEQAATMADCRRHLRAAGLGYDVPLGVLHNALIGESQGRPWAGLDYDALHKADELRRVAYEPFRQLDEWARDTLRTCDYFKPLVAS